MAGPELLFSKDNLLSCMYIKWYVYVCTNSMYACSMYVPTYFMAGPELLFSKDNQLSCVYIKWYVYVCTNSMYVCMYVCMYVVCMHGYEGVGRRGASKVKAISRSIQL